MLLPPKVVVIHLARIYPYTPDLLGKWPKVSPDDVFGVKKENEKRSKNEGLFSELFKDI
jgi:hypothetical protein